ncbi:Trk system potassium transporter TrkA [Actinobacillus equuli subsp. haemolyticus]|uniref:Trk system potassium transporter TrkA n=1 Tax=Actinobacillus equuli TaxID=718 RepID=UPI00241836A7|nr:Trk system potassium transporter TrkA [Actinobacillus equuli]MDG4953146.1 Trk system potassium transporter TrkA [Actinobacillus equuli subsp. equuli]WGE41796.1 Trk system potassium transporter TrkA [Actinobacillus equuli subsp. haemolyticus]WGE46159.1 Trk system potassium transporter TrkA [Actinobacillus equuli subsp. haemolyticus]WGE52516.1 Trk system potassium transporter TrkA [Actinobacillus equuli subsp. haemolyticus]WGE62788.1 Trk system potassium transporter TrkA [Actinobacillus equul
MKIIILGAGQVGSTLAENLVSEDNDITLIDDDQGRLNTLQDKHDLQVLKGNGASPQVLRDAGASDADLIVAVTESDETNMIACQIAHTLFHIPTKIARIRNSDYVREKEKLFTDSALPIDHIIAPEVLVKKEILRLIDYPGALQVAHFANELVSLVSVKAYYGGPLVGYPISALRDHLPYIEARIVSIFRQDRAIIPQGSTIIEAGDEVFFICATHNIKAVMSELQRLDKPHKRVMIVGGGSIGTGLAKDLEEQCSVKMIERDPRKAEKLAEKLEKALVLCGDASDQELLFEEHIENIDLFLALTSDDEANIMSALLAKRLGAKKAIVLVQKMAYLHLIQGGTIDIALSPKQATISALSSHVRKGDIVQVASLKQGQAECIEAIAHGDAESSKVVGRTVRELKLPQGAIVGAIVRNEEIIIAHKSTQIEENDRVIVFVNDKKQVSEIEKLFQLSTFFL